VSGPKDVDDYLAAVPEGPRAALESVRATVRSVAPDVTETISYQIPTFKWRGRGLMAYAAFKDHCSIFPMSKAVTAGEEFDEYRSGKGTLRFTVDRPIPARVVERIVRGRMEELAARAGRS
jgi:uncharacterized protein YdhG (YjbR/CyaY superfamily)